MKKVMFVATLALTLFPYTVHSAPTKVGNGDDGSDLEGFNEITKGSIVDAKKEAMKLLQSLNISGVAGLGTLLPEVESTKLFLTKKDVNAVETADAGAFHADMKGRVYARTFAEPHAATRFFPVAEKLDQDQLVALHVHEGLHRALPPSVREDEAVVAALTLAITSPGASFDSVNRAAIKQIPERDRLPQNAVASSNLLTGSNVSAVNRYPIPDNARVKNPSEFSYSYRKYKSPKEVSAFQIDAMHVLRSDLYPFGTDEGPIGIGIEASFIQRPNESLMGPLSLSGRTRIWSSRGYDVGMWGVMSLNTLSNSELKNSQFGRDTASVGFSMKKDLKFFSIENYLGYMFEGESKQSIGGVDYTYDYGSVITASIHPSVNIGPFRLGAFAEMNLGDHYRISGGAFDNDIGRYRVVSGGPEFSIALGNNMSAGLTGRFMINSTKDADFGMMGDLMGPGVAQGNVSGTFSIFF